MPSSISGPFPVWNGNWLFPLSPERGLFPAAGVWKQPHESYPPRCPCCSEVWVGLQYPDFGGGIVYHQACYCRGVCLSCGLCCKHCDCGKKEGGVLVYLDTLPRLERGQVLSLTN